MLASRPVTLLVAGAIGALFLAGLIVDGLLGALLVLLVVVVLVVITAATWQHAPAHRRSLRLAIIGLVAVIAVVKLVQA